MTVAGATPHFPFRFESGREACRHLLQCARTDDGHFLPLTAAELATRMQAGGFSVTTLDAEALLRELAADGEVAEIDELAGYRWIGCAA